jgi:hypothetical protein
VEVEIETATRSFSVACDWCATPMTWQIRREQAGKMVLVHAAHVDRHGRPCRGSGRGIAVWPVNMELRVVSGFYELRIGQGAALGYSNPGTLVVKLQEFGLDREEALRRIGAVTPGRPYSFEVSERRRQPRARGQSSDR